MRTPSFLPAAALLSAISAAAACSPTPSPDRSKIEERASALVGAALITIEQNGFHSQLCIAGPAENCPDQLPPVRPSRTWDLPAGDWPLNHVFSRGFDGNSTMGSVNVTAAGVVTLRGNAAKHFTISASPRAATLRAKTTAITIDCNGYPLCADSLHMGANANPLIQPGAQQGTVILVPERKYSIADIYSLAAEADTREIGNGTDDEYVYALGVLADGTVSITDPGAQGTLIASGSTVRLAVATLTIDYKGYETQYAGSLPNMRFWGFQERAGTTVKLLRGRRSLLGDFSSHDPVRGTWPFAADPDLKISGAGVVSLGADTGRHMTAIGPTTVAPRLGFVRIERGGYSGGLCVADLALSCAPANADLQAALVLERDYNVGGSPVRVNADGTCNVASVVVGGATLAVRCGLTRPPPGATTPPPAPAGLTGVQAGPGRVDLAWSNVTGETGYRVQRSSNGASFTDIAALAANTTGHSDDSAIEGATNHYRVIAFNHIGASPPSNVVAVDVTAPGTCGGTGNPCPDPAVTQFNHNKPRIDYRRERVPLMPGDQPVRGLVSDASNGELPAPPPTVSCVGSRVDDLRWSFSQDSVDFNTGAGVTDFGSCAAAASEAGNLPSLQLRRYHRPRLEHAVSSFGPGVFSNFDAKVAFHRTGVDGFPNAVLIDPETDAPPLTLFERSAADSADADDGIFHDKETRTYRRLVLYTGTTPTPAARVASIFQATLAVLEGHDGGAIWFELVTTNPGNPDLVDARPVAYVDRNGNRFNVQYQFARNATDSQLGFDRTQLWKMTKVVDVLHGHEISFGHHLSPGTGRWLVDTVTSRLPDGTARLYTYGYTSAGGAADTLVEVKYPNGETSRFAKAFDPATQLWGLTHDDAGLGKSALRKTVWVTGPVFRTPDGRVHGQTMNLVRRVVNGDQEEVLRLAEDPNDGGVTYVTEGGRRLTRLATDSQGAPREVARARAVTADPLAATYDVVGTYAANAQGMITTVTDAAGKVRTLTRDLQTRRITGLVARDGSAASWTFNAAGKPTRLVDRVGQATDASYDTRANLLSVTLAPGTALQAITRFTYNGAGQILTQQDALGRTTNHAYDARGYLSSVTEPPDTAGGTRATTAFETGAFGLQTAKVDPSGRRTTYQYDARNRLTGTTYPDGTTETVTYGTGLLSGLVTERKDRNGVLETLEYDSTRRLKKVIKASNRPEKTEEVFEYLPGTELVSAAIVAGERTEYSYDERSREVARRRFPTHGKVLLWQRAYDGLDRLAAETDPFGRKIHHLYDSTGREVRTVRELVPGGVPAGATPATLPRVSGANPPYVVDDRARDAMGRVLSAIDERGVTTTFAHDAHGRMTEKVDAAGTAKARTTRYEYDLAGNRTKVIHPRAFREAGAFETRYTYTGRDLLASRTEAAGTAAAATTTYAYTSTRQFSTVTDPRGGVKTYGYDGNDRLRTLRDAGSFTTTYAYDGAGNQTSVTNPLGQVTTFTYDGHRRRLSARNPAGETTSHQYDDNLTDGAGLDLTFHALIAPLGFGANASGYATLTINPAGETSLTVQDGLLRRVLMTDGNGNVTRTSHDTVLDGLVEVAVTNALGNVSRARLDGLDRERSTVDMAGKVSMRGYDPGGNLLATRDPNGVGQDCSFDELSRQTSCTDTQGDTRSFEYDAAGNVVATVDGAGARSTCTYDARDRRASCADRNGAVSTWAHDKNDNLTSMTDAQGGVTRYTYDARDLRTSATFPDSTGTSDRQSFAYDGAGRLVSRTLQNGNVITLVYDTAGRITQRRYPDGRNDSFTYDLASRLRTAASARYGSTVTFTYDNAGRPTKESLSFQGRVYDVSTTFDAGGRRTRLRYPDLSEVNRTYTTRDQLASLALGTRAIASYAHDDAGRPTTITLGNGLVESRNYRPDDRLLAASTPGVGDLSYSYDRAKRKLSEDGSAAPGGTQSFTYDPEGRLTAWALGTTTQSWTLSACGDWTRTIRGATTENRTHNAAHELTAVGTATLSYDSRGNMSRNDRGQTMSYDLESRQQQFSASAGGTTTTVTLFYDALGRKVAKAVAVSGGATTTTVFVNAGGDTIAEYVNNALSVNYVIGAGTDDHVAMVKAGKPSWYTRNHLGTVTAVTDELSAVKERYRYTAFGERTILSPSGTVLASSAIGNQIGFTGRYHDKDSGLMDFRFRQYDPRLGRFVSRDDAYREGANLYMAYFVPSATDPSGHAAESTLASLAGPRSSPSSSLARATDPRRAATLRSACPQVLYAISSAEPEEEACSGSDENGCKYCVYTDQVQRAYCGEICVETVTMKHCPHKDPEIEGEPEKQCVSDPDPACLELPVPESTPIVGPGGPAGPPPTAPSPPMSPAPPGQPQYSPQQCTDFHRDCRACKQLAQKLLDIENRKLGKLTFIEHGTTAARGAVGIVGEKSPIHKGKAVAEGAIEVNKTVMSHGVEESSAKQEFNARMDECAARSVCQHALKDCPPSADGIIITPLN